MRSVALICAAGVFALSACASGSTPPTSAPAPTTAQTPPVARSSAPKELGTIKASGFGQQDQYVWVTAVVHNNSDLVGQTVTVNFNVLDNQGNLLKSQSQVESFFQPGADHAVGTQVGLEPGQKAAKVETTLDVEASGTFSDKPFPTLPITKVKVGKGQYGEDVASFEVSNPLTVALKSPRIAVVCTDAAGAIIGGGSEFPTLLPASGKVKVDASINVSGKPARCTVYSGPPFEWDGEGVDGIPGTASAPPSATSEVDAGSPEGAFKTWMEHFNAKEWAAQYATLVSAQQAVISKSQYEACRSRSTAPKFKWVKVLAVTDAGPTAIPGTKVKLPATKVRVEVSVAGMKTPVDAHMYQEGGQWKWSMTQENISSCG
jgi:hypothetical protein